MISGSVTYMPTSQKPASRPCATSPCIKAMPARTSTRLDAEARTINCGPMNGPSTITATSVSMVTRGNFRARNSRPKPPGLYNAACQYRASIKASTLNSCSITAVEATSTGPISSPGITGLPSICGRACTSALANTSKVSRSTVSRMRL
ncbi:hypothetical protein D3C76_1105500 [compost metagenome]